MGVQPCFTQQNLKSSFGKPDKKKIQHFVIPKGKGKVIPVQGVEALSVERG
jgi:hypothetical protein